MPSYDPNKYSLDYALWNIGDYFWRLYRDELKIFAEHRNRMDIIDRIHNEWNPAANCTPYGTDIRIDWALAIYDHGDWEKSLTTPVPPFKKNGNPIVTSDPRRKYPAEFRSDSGIYVRSLSEMCIANWLYANRIPFEYERKVFFKDSGEYAHCDFYLPDFDVYVEFWGISNDKSYEHYKLWKENNYKRNNIPLISFYPSDLKRFRDRFNEEITQIKRSK